MDVPYRATVVTAGGGTRNIEGVWQGVTTHKLIVTQAKFDTVTHKVEHATEEIVGVSPKEVAA